VQGAGADAGGGGDFWGQAAKPVMPEGPRLLMGGLIVLGGIQGLLPKAAEFIGGEKREKNGFDQVRMECSNKKTTDACRGPKYWGQGYLGGAPGAHRFPQTRYWAPKLSMQGGARAKRGPKRAGGLVGSVDKRGAGLWRKTGID